MTLILGPFWPKVVLPIKVSSWGQIELVSWLWHRSATEREAFGNVEYSRYTLTGVAVPFYGLICGSNKTVEPARYAQKNHWYWIVNFT